MNISNQTERSFILGQLAAILQDYRREPENFAAQCSDDLQYLKRGVDYARTDRDYPTTEIDSLLALVVGEDDWEPLSDVERSNFWLSYYHRKAKK